MRMHTQTLLGNHASPVGARGNCYQAALASVLNRDLEDVPHVFAGHLPRLEAWAALDAWLRTQNLSRVRVTWADLAHTAHTLTDRLLIVVGRAPSRTHLHAVVGRIHADRLAWSIVHDPAPQASGLDGNPHYFEAFFTLSDRNIPTRSPPP